MGCTALVWVGTRTFSIPAYLQKVAVSVSALWRKAGAVLLTTFREKFDTTDERLRLLNSASSPGNARGHVPRLPAAGWKVSISTTGSSRMAWNEALCPSWHTVTQFSLCQLCQTRQHRFLGTSTSHAPLRDTHFETGHWIYQLPSGKKKRLSTYNNLPKNSGLWFLMGSLIIDQEKKKGCSSENDEFWWSDGVILGQGTE